MTERELPKSLDEAWLEMVEQKEIADRRERQYRKLKARKMLESQGKWTANERVIWVNAQTANARYKRDIATSMYWSLKQYFDYRLAQMSYEQSKMKAERGLDESHTYK